MTADEWNVQYPVGTRVRYWPVKGRGEYIDSQTRSAAWELGHGEPVVSIRGKAGGVVLSHLVALEERDPSPICDAGGLQHGRIEPMSPGGRLTEEQSDRFAELAAQAPLFEEVEAERDPNFVPGPKACPLCKKRGKNWYGDDPTCAFLTGEFDPDNWNCATMNALRGLEDRPQARRWCCDDQSLLVFPLEGEFLILSWYKNRGRVNGAWTLYSDLIEPLTLEAAERIIQDREN